MALHLTPRLLEATYELVRATPPFNRWRLPPADEVEFRVKELGHTRSGKILALHRALYPRKSIRHIISIDPTRRKVALLVEDMAHEMVHLYQRRHLDKKVGHCTAAHGTHFKRLAAQVCRTHGWDVATF